MDINGDWSKLPLAVIDFETTGLDPDKDRIVEYGVALFNDGKFLEVMGGFVNPEMPISEAASKVNGITDADVQRAPVFRFVYAHVLNIVLNGFIPVAYNAKFDREFLLQEVSRVMQEKVVERTRELNTMFVTPELIRVHTNGIMAFNPNVEWIDPLV